MYHADVLLNVLKFDEKKFMGTSHFLFYEPFYNRVPTLF